MKKSQGICDWLCPRKINKMSLSSTIQTIKEFCLILSKDKIHYNKVSVEIICEPAYDASESYFILVKVPICGAKSHFYKVKGKTVDEAFANLLQVLKDYLLEESDERNEEFTKMRELSEACSLEINRLKKEEE